jgi:hypothetical protein
MTSEHPPTRSARPEIDPHDPPDALHPEGGPGGRDPGEQEPDEQASGADRAPGETPRPQPSGGL